MRRLKKLASLGFMLSAFMFAAANQAQAQNTTASMQVQLEITPGCNIAISGGNLIDLGKFISLESGAAGQGKLEVKCSKGSNIKYTITLNEGSNGGQCDSDGSATGATKQRCMQNTATKGKYIPYNIYKESAHQNVWGMGKDAFTGTYGDKDSELLDFYVWVKPIKTGLYTGLYTDTVIAQITY